jgi:alpha-tubulin suppressor-like RCC1 family protein
MKFVFLLLTFIFTFSINATYLDLDEVVGGGPGGGAVDSVFGRTGAVSASFGDYSAGLITNVPAGTIAALTVQNAINELDVEKLNLTGGILTGDLQLNTLLKLRDDDTNLITIQAPVNILADYTLTLPVDDGLTGQVLSTNGSGVLSWFTLPTPNQVIDADLDTKVHLDETADDDKIRFDTAGFERMIIDNVGAIGVGTSAPNASSLMEMASTTKGVLIPRMTSAQRIAISPVESLIVYDTDLDDFMYYSASALDWKFLTKSTSDSDNDSAAYFDKTLGDNTFRINTNGSEKLNLAPSGNLAIGKASSVADASALIEMVSTTKGFALPRMTSAQRDAIVTPIEGLLVYATDLDKFSYYNGTSWVNTPYTPVSWSYIQDADANTRIQLEEGANDNTIRFDVDGVQKVVIESDGDMSVGIVEPAVMEPTAAFQVDSTTKGFLVPRLTTTQRNSITPPAESLLVYDTDINDYYYYDSALTTWKPLYNLQDLDADTKIRFTEPTVDSDAIRFDTLGAERVVIDNTGSVGVGTTAPVASALLELTSTTKGALLPRMTTLERDAIATPATGLIVYDTTLNYFYYYNSFEWLPIDNGIGHGVVGTYSFNFTAASITANGDILINFQRVNPTTGKVESKLKLITGGTVIATGAAIGANQTAYVSAKYDWDLDTVSFVNNTNANSVNIGLEVLLAGPFTNASSEITGYVSFYHFATDTTTGWSDDLADTERARIINGVQHSLVLPATPTDGSQYHFSYGSGTTFNSLLRDPIGHISDFLAKNTSTTNEVYKYKPGQVEYDFVPAGTPALIAGQWWDPTANGGLGGYAIVNNNQYTVTTFWAFPGNAGNQYVGMMVDDEFYATYGEAANSVFTGQTTDNKPEGLDAAALVGYLILRGNTAAHHSYGVPANEGTDWDFFGPRDAISITTTASGSALPLNDLSNVNVPTPLPGQILSWDSVNIEWIAGPWNITQATRDGLTTQTTGSLIYNTTTNFLNYWNGTEWLTIPAGGGDATAIHVDAANEISGITLKATPVAADLLVIEDSQAANVKKRITIGTIDHDTLLNFVANEHIDWTVDQSVAFPAGINTANYIEGGPGTDTTAFHRDVNGEFASLTAKTTPVAGDFLVIESLADTNAKRSLTFGNLQSTLNHDSLAGFVANEHIDWTAASAGTIDVSNYIEGGPGTDTTAFHDVANELTTKTTIKTTPTNADILLIQDQADAGNLKHATIASVVALAAGGAQTKIEDTDGDTRIETEFTTDDDTLTFFVGNLGAVADRKALTIDDNLATLQTSSGLTINPREEDNTQSLNGVPLIVKRYFTPSGSLQPVAEYSASLLTGQTVIEDDGGYIALSAQRPTAINPPIREAVRLGWKFTSAADETLTEGVFTVGIETPIDLNVRDALEVRQGRTKIFGNNTVSSGKLTINDSLNQFGLTLSIPDFLPSSYQINFPSTAPTANQVLEVTSVAGSTATTAWVDTPTGGGSGATFDPAKTWILNQGEGQAFDIVYNGKYVAIGGAFSNTAQWPYFLGGHEGEDPQSTYNMFIEPTFSTHAGTDDARLGGTPQSKVPNIAKMINTGESQIIIDNAGSMYTFGGDTDNNNYGVLLGNCTNNSTEGLIGYQIGTGICTQDGNGQTIPTTGWKDVQAYVRFDAHLYNHACAIASDDSLWCWGYNGSGQIGTGDTALKNRPTKIDVYRNNDTNNDITMPAISKIVMGFSGSTTNDGGNSLVITANGIPLVAGDGTWGNNGDGSTADNTRFGTLSGDLSPSNLSNAGAEVVDAWFHGGYAGGFCAIREIITSGIRTLYCWGYNNSGQVGTGNVTNRTTPWLVDFTNVTKTKDVVGTIGSGYSVLKGDGTNGYWGTTTNCAIVQASGDDAGGGLYCWGENGQYLVGDNSTTDRYTPVPVDTGGLKNDGWTDLWLNNTHTSAASVFGTSVSCASNLRNGGSTFCWGYNNSGAMWKNDGGPLRDGLSSVTVITDYVKSPTLMPAFVGVTIDDLVCKPWGNVQTCLAIDTDGEIYCSGQKNGSCPGDNQTSYAGVGWYLSSGKQLFLK